MLSAWMERAKIFWRPRFVGNIFVVYRSDIRHHRLPDCEDLTSKPQAIVSGIPISVGPHWYGALVTLTVIYAAWSLFRDMVTRSRLSAFSKSLLIDAETVLGALTTVFFCLCSLSDPGIVLPADLTDDDIREEEILSDWCDICDVHQYEHLCVRHCHSCGVCVEQMDHHCPWIGKCIGRGNMHWFIMFNISWVLGIILLVIVAILL